MIRATWPFFGNSTDDLKYDTDIILRNVRYFIRPLTLISAKQISLASSYSHVTVLTVAARDLSAILDTDDPPCLTSMFCFGKE